jgi:non-heme chloroperoxidase
LRAAALGSGLIDMQAAFAQPTGANHTPARHYTAKDGYENMSFIKTEDGTEIFYKDWGRGQPIVFSHGWPLSADDWDTQMLFLLNNGYRVIAAAMAARARSPTAMTWIITQTTLRL